MKKPAKPKSDQAPKSQPKMHSRVFSKRGKWCAAIETRGFPTQQEAEKSLIFMLGALDMVAAMSAQKAKQSDQRIITPDRAFNDDQKG